MSEKILYYFGAGASAKVFPLARTTYTNFGSQKIARYGLAETLEHFKEDFARAPNIPADIKNGLSDTTGFIAEQGKSAKAFGDIDTFAKYLFLRGARQDFRLLKQYLSCYFMLAEGILDYRDDRYLPWLITILNRKSFPDNIKILSWNYDFQLEYAAAKFGSLENIRHSPNAFVYDPGWLNYYPNLDPTFSDFQSLTVYHLNGLACFAKDQKGNLTKHVYEQEGDARHQLIADAVQESKESESMLFFAWEQNNSDIIMQQIQHMLKDVSIMVVVGYSFPFFNREIDKRIFNVLTTSGHLRKIYYQDPRLNGEHMRDKFELQPHVKIVHVADTDNFHVPFEY